MAYLTGKLKITTPVPLEWPALFTSSQVQNPEISPCENPEERFPTLVSGRNSPLGQELNGALRELVRLEKFRKDSPCTSVLDVLTTLRLRTRE